MVGIDQYTKLMLHLNGSGIATSPTDDSDSGHTVTANGSPLYTDPILGLGCASFDGSGDYLNIADSADWDFGTGEFTVDFWVRTSQTGSYPTLISRQGASASWGFYLENGIVCWYNPTHGLLKATGTTVNDGDWHHVAVSKDSSNVVRIFIDGVIKYSATQTSAYTGSTSLRIGYDDVNVGLNGQFDEIRISKGVARWTANFTPPTTEYTSDANTKLLLHLNSDFNDSSGSAHSVSKSGNTFLFTTKFGSSALNFNGTSQYLSSADSTDWDFGSGDFTIDTWVNFTSFSSVNPTICARVTNSNSYFYFTFEAGNLRFRDYGGSIDFYRPFSVSNNTWYHVAITRSGNDFRLFLDGIQLGATYNSSASMIDRAVDLDIGYMSQNQGYRLNGLLDEFRWSKGIARWTSNFTPPTSEYTGNTVDEEETLNISEDIKFQENWGDAETLNISENLETSEFPSFKSNETLNISEDIAFQENWEQDETLEISEDVVISQSLEKFISEETLNISEFADIDNEGKIDYLYPTDLRTLLGKTYIYATQMITSLFSSFKYATKLNTKVDTNTKYTTDLRVRYNDYDSIPVGSLNDIIVKLDGSELTDVDYSTLNITWNLNKTPSLASFTLARRHDKLDYKLDNTLSEITDENKIEIYDGTYKLFTGYITTIYANSSTDTVKINAEDVRYKFSRTSLNLWYGGKWEVSETDEYSYTKSEKNIGSAIQEVITDISSLISGYDALPFSGVNVPEYVEVYNDCATLLDNLILQTANVNWYIDENERLKYQKIEHGTIKTLPLSSIDEHRHLYDVIISDVTLNKQKSLYAKSLEVKLGKHIIKKWTRRPYMFYWQANASTFLQGVKDKTYFAFQSWARGIGNSLLDFWYCGINTSIHYYYITTPGFWIIWVLVPKIVAQWLYKDTNNDIPSIIVGSGLPKKTIHLNSYGKKETTVRWEEKIKPAQPPFTTEDAPYLVWITEENYDYTNYALDIANFDLNQNNKLLTSARITMLLDASKYYNINFQNRINLSNTLNTTIYKNNNGFPLNIQQMSFNASTRTITLNVTNYGKTWYNKTANYISTFTKPTIKYIQPKEQVRQYQPGVDQDV